jgi:hypothetical protein
MTTDHPWFEVKVVFEAKDLVEAERIADGILDVVCGGEIGMGIHSCKRISWVMVGPSVVEDDE